MAITRLKRINTRAPLPMMIPPAAVRFNRLRKTVFAESGIDFLARCADVSRIGNFESKKSGVSRESWHRAGRAFDYDQTSNSLIIVPEEVDRIQYFRTYLICSDQTGSNGVKRELIDYRGFTVNVFVFDFTAAAEIEHFERIPAHEGWREPTGYNLREFWHYQYNPEKLSWKAAMAQII